MFLTNYKRQQAPSSAQFPNKHGRLIKRIDFIQKGHLYGAA
jgi:hypothetical protein